MVQITQIQINNNTYVIGKIKHWDKNIENKINNSIIKCAEELDKNGIFDKINKIICLRQLIGNIIMMAKNKNNGYTTAE